MSDVVIGCDNNNGRDHDFQNTVANALEKEGHTVEKYPIGPNFASYAYSGKSKGKIGVFIIAPALTALCDFYDGNINFKYSYMAIRGDVDSGMTNQNQFETVPIYKDKHGDCKSKSCNPFNGKTYTYINNVTKAKCQAIFGATPEEMAENLIKAMGGETDTSNNGGSASTIKDALKEVLSGWDGDVECFVQEDTVYVRKIQPPQSATVSIIESQNIIYDSVSLTDVIPSTINELTVTYDKEKIVLKDEYLIERFGKIPKSITADSKITSKHDLESYAETEWAKIKRENGRILECKVIGDVKWKSGQWCRVYIPSYNLDCYMYITKVSQSDSSDDWVCNLKLVDYPPSFGKEIKKNNTKTNDNDNTTTEGESV